MSLGVTFNLGWLVVQLPTKPRSAFSVLLKKSSKPVSRLLNKSRLSGLFWSKSCHTVSF